MDRCLDSLNLSAFETDVVVRDPEHELGFAGAIQKGWDQVLKTGCEFVFHVESDFTFNRPVQFGPMSALARDPDVAQVALKRQPWNPTEEAAGGIIECDPDSYEEQWLVTDTGMYAYTRHRKFFSTNPSLYRTELCERGWPQERESEGKFGIRLFADHPEMHSTFWGSKLSPPAVEHIGLVRAGHGY